MLFLSFFFFQNRLQAKVIHSNTTETSKLMFTDIIILGMDKQPTNFTVSLSNSITSISNVAYDVSSKVRDRSILAGPLSEAPA